MARSSTKSSTSSKKKAPIKASSNRKSPSSGGNLKTPEAISQAVFDLMCQEHSFGVEEWAKADLAQALGYKNPRSDKFAKGITILTKTKGLATSVGTMTKNSLKLTDKGVDSKPKEVKATSLVEFHERFLEQVDRKAKCSKVKIQLIWDYLKDRKVHDVAKVSEHAGYGSVRSFGNTKVIPTLKAMGLVEDAGKGKVQMTDKAFPAGLV